MTSCNVLGNDEFIVHSEECTDIYCICDFCNGNESETNKNEGVSFLTILTQPELCSAADMSISEM
jgi:hypothetical protein